MEPLYKKRLLRIQIREQASENIAMVQKKRQYDIRIVRKKMPPEALKKGGANNSIKPHNHRVEAAASKLNNDFDLG